GRQKVGARRGAETLLCRRVETFRVSPGSRPLQPGGRVCERPKPVETTRHAPLRCTTEHENRAKNGGSGAHPKRGERSIVDPHTGNVPGGRNPVSRQKSRAIPEKRRDESRRCRHECPRHSLGPVESATCGEVSGE